MKDLRQKGFTLIEILVVIGILAILLAIVLIAINPQQQFQQANNTQRSSDVNAVLNAISAYSAANSGALPVGVGDVDIDATVRTITNDPLVTNSIDLCAELVPDYIADLPFDPTDGDEDPANSICTDVGADYNTGYTVVLGAGNRITVAAPGAEGTTISVSR